MKATTVKLHGEILDDIERQKPSDQSLTAFVREAVRRDLQRRQLREAAEAYCAHLAHHQEEGAWMEAWEQADLASPLAPVRISDPSDGGGSHA